MLPLAASHADAPERYYSELFKFLASDAAVIGIPPTDAEELIHEVIMASLFKPRPSPKQWAAVTLAAAVTHMESPK